MSNLVLISRTVIPDVPAGDDVVTNYQWNKDTHVVDTVATHEPTGTYSGFDLPTTTIVDQYWDGSDFKRVFHDGIHGVNINSIAAPNVHESNQCNLEIALPINNTPYYDVSNKGSVDVRSVGGVAPIEFDLDGGIAQATGYFSGLSAGTYTVTATDANGCTDSVDVTIETFSSYVDWKGITIQDHLGRDVELTIQRQGFIGSKTELCFAGTPLEITQENTGGENNGLIIQTATLNVIETVDGEFDNVINSNAGEYCLKVKITDPSTVYETYLQYDPEDVTVMHFDVNKQVTLRFKTDVIDSEDKIEDYSGFITPIKLLSHFFTAKDTFKKVFNCVTSLRENNDATTYAYETLDRYYFDASICNGLTQREVVNMLCDTFNLTMVSGKDHYIFQSNLISVDTTKTARQYDNIGENETATSELTDLRSIVNPTAGTLNYVNRSQQYRFNKQLKNVELSQSITNKQELTVLSPLWSGSTLSNYTNPSSLTIYKLTDKDGERINEGVQILGVSEFVKDADFLRSEPYYLSEGISKIQIEISVEVPGANAQTSVDIVTSFSAQVLYGNNSMTDLTTFDLGVGSFLTKDITKTNTQETLKFKNTLPTGADYLTIVLYQLQDTSTSGYVATKVNVNSVKVEVLPNDSYYGDEVSFTEEVNAIGVTESIDLKLGDTWNVNNAPSVFTGALLRDDLTRTSTWVGEKITGAKPLIEALGEYRSEYKSRKIKTLSCTLIDDPPKWNTTYTDATIPGAYFRVLPNWQYDIKTNQLRCELLEMIISTASTGNRLLESSDIRLLETADIRQLE